MKKKVITMSILALLNGFSSSSHALDPSVYNGTTGEITSQYEIFKNGAYIERTVNIYMSGSSAFDSSIINWFAQYQCKPGTMDVYKTNTQFVIFCSVPFFSSSTSPANIAFYKNSDTGSSNSLSSLANSTPIPFLDLEKLKKPNLITSTVTIAANTNVSLPIQSYRVHDVKTTLPATYTMTNTPSQAVFSDVEPELLGVTPTQLNKLSVTSGDAYPNALIYGVVVTKQIRDLLQAKEGLTVGSETEANMPNLSKAQISGIFTGQITQWSQLGLKGLTDNTIYVARMKRGSGTFEVFDIYFTGATCTGGVAGFVTANGNACNNQGSVYESSSNSDLTACMSNYSNQNLGAIGTLATLNVPVDPYSNLQNINSAYRFIKINGAAPTLLNVVEGKYDLYAETSLLTKYPDSLPSNSLQLDWIHAIYITFRAPAACLSCLTTSSIAKINSGFLQTWGSTGFLGVPRNGPTPVVASGSTISSADITANPVHTHTKSPAGLPNNCQPSLPIANTDLFSKP